MPQEKPISQRWMSPAFSFSDFFPIWHFFFCASSFSEDGHIQLLHNIKVCNQFTSCTVVGMTLCSYKNLTRMQNYPPPKKISDHLQGNFSTLKWSQWSAHYSKCAWIQSSLIVPQKLYEKDQEHCTEVSLYLLMLLPVMHNTSYNNVCRILFVAPWLLPKAELFTGFINFSHSDQQEVALLL